MNSRLISKVRWRKLNETIILNVKARSDFSLDSQCFKFLCCFVVSLNTPQSNLNLCLNKSTGTYHCSNRHRGFQCL